MSSDPLPFDAALEGYEKQAQALFEALKSGDEAAAWRFKWNHPRFRGKSITDVRAATLELADAQAVIAREYSLESWPSLVSFTDAVQRDGTVSPFETAVEPGGSGTLPTL